MMQPIRVAILGASGYGAGELLRLFVQHPHVRVVSITSTTQVDATVDVVHPHLRGFYDLRITRDVDWDRLVSAEHAVLISTLPHGASGAAIDGILQRPEASRLRIIDLSGDLRLKDERLHAAAYPKSAPLSDRRGAFFYGLPELHRRQIVAARCVANPGCLATAAILAAAPLVGADFTGPVSVDAKTGSSGSGSSLKETTHHPTRHADFRAYKPLDHAHEPEILQAWNDPDSRRIQLSFVAHSMPTSRGIFATVHLTLPEPTDTATLVTRFQQFYADSPFARIGAASPTLQDVVGSNFCDIGLAVRGRQVIAMAALDNLIKGMAGTAIQNLNLMCGLPETTGLWMPSMRPV